MKEFRGEGYRIEMKIDCTVTFDNLNLEMVKRSIVSFRGNLIT